MQSTSVNYTTTKKRIQPYDFRVSEQTVTISNTRGQTLKVTRDQIIRQLERTDMDAHRRVMYENALIAIDRHNNRGCRCLTYIGDNNCPIPAHRRD